MINLIAAVSRNNVIGVNNQLPWIIPEDLKYFKKMTSNHVIVMGWNTWLSLGEKPLPNRMNLVLSRSHKPIVRDKKVRIINNPMEVYMYARREPLYVIGGAQVYNIYLSIADNIYITRVDQSIATNGDVKYFPTMNNFTCVEKSEVYESSVGKQKYWFEHWKFSA